MMSDWQPLILASFLPLLFGSEKPSLHSDLFKLIQIWFHSSRKSSKPNLEIFQLGINFYGFSGNFRWWNSPGLWACRWGGRPCWGTQTCWPLRRRWCTWSGASAPETRRLDFMKFSSDWPFTYRWQHRAQRVQLGAQLPESSIVVISCFYFQ